MSVKHLKYVLQWSYITFRFFHFSFHCEFAPDLNTLPYCVTLFFEAFVHDNYAFIVIYDFAERATPRST